MSSTINTILFIALHFLELVRNCISNTCEMTIKNP